ncbi:MAG: SDR family oxidoreductase [Porticoccaceae bacterium]|nr:SDR family oxidoreductase [Pseudomonadales bacterium]MCP5172533.1 SDR family oxidoreductase [Pseudomonadales bacterium]
MTNLETLFSMKGKVVVITGAGTGMGKQFSHTLAKAGAKVVCVARNADRLEQVVADIRKLGGEAIAVAGDVGDRQSIESVFDQTEEDFGRANVLVHCAAQADYSLFPDIDDETWDNLVKVNLSGTMRLCRSFSQRLITAEEPGAIVIITSITGDRVMPGMPGYSTLKAASNQLVKAMARDMFGRDIRVNALSPGYFRTEMSADLFDTEEGRALIQLHPLKRLGNVEELDGPLLLLASDASCHMNGSIVTVDAGHSIALA